MSFRHRYEANLRNQGVLDTATILTMSKVRLEEKVVPFSYGNNLPHYKSGPVLRQEPSRRPIRWQEW
jgi:hypothetical protein